MTQNFVFENATKSEKEAFVNTFSKRFFVQNEKGGFLITNKSHDFTFFIAIEDYGFYTSRSGDYFCFLGLFLEEITGKFGEVRIEDK